MTNPFTPRFESLPSILAVFPLSGAIVMPGTQLPLNIFEPRYLNLVLDTLRDERLFGMIQPDPSAPETQDRPLCRTGCAGRITSFSETTDGRIVLVLTGLCRFDVREELPSVRGYRRIVADWSRFAGDYQTTSSGEVERPQFLNQLRAYCDCRGVEVPWGDLDSLNDADLINLLAAHLPLHPGDKQALVEAIDLNQRAKLLTAFLELGATHEDDRRRH
jgi:uncharacterized protein